MPCCAPPRVRRSPPSAPRSSDFVLKMPRGAQVIYPKDLGPLLLLADIFPGARVLESGVGSGALSMTLLRAGALVTGYELRADFAARATKNVEAFLEPELTEHYAVELRDCYEGIDLENLDRIVLDLPEPWQVVKHAERALHPGGILVAYTPSIVQAVTLREHLDESAVRAARHPRGAAAPLAHRRPVGPARPPHGGPHRVPHPRPAASGLTSHETVDEPPRRRDRRPARHGGGRRVPARVPHPGHVVDRPGRRRRWSERCCSRAWPGSSTAATVATPRSLVAAGVMLGCALAGQALGLFIGTKLHLALPPGPVQKVDAGVGSVAGLLGVLVAVWLIVPAMADVPDWPARQARTSSVARAIDDLFPTPPDTSRVLRRPGRRAVPAGVRHPAPGARARASTRRQRARRHHLEPGGDVDGEGGGRRLRPHPGGLGIRRRAGPGRHQRPRGRRRTPHPARAFRRHGGRRHRGGLRSEARPGPAAGEDDRSPAVAGGRHRSGRPGSGVRSSRRRHAPTGAVPGGATRSRPTAPTSTTAARCSARCCCCRPRYGRATRDQPSSTLVDGWSGWRSPSHPTDPMSPTPSAPASCGPCSPFRGRRRCRPGRAPTEGRRGAA